MKKIFSILICLLTVCSVVFATPVDKMTKLQALNAARMHFALKSVEGIVYNVYIISDDEEYIGNKYFWAESQFEENWQGHYHIYIAPQNKPDEIVRQDVALEKNRPYHRSTMILNITSPTLNGFYIIKGKQDWPDFLFFKQRACGSSSFSSSTFAIKHGKVQEIEYQNVDGEIFTPNNGRKSPYYTAEGDIAFPWWTNALETRGSYITVYRFDKTKMLLQALYTVKQTKVISYK
ncbi:hypothetical protein I6E26_10335 [Anaerovibrio lipolyticus]|uniref:hypothetical protein n=1 Tax=Anaerovibrio lipolyticus TaxID=82374 RepID=UPI001F1AA63F|nr:hypothetical protein [Anaerovibrio lipolyticus]MCF2601929.1 hypothetical protein [Anaerovibrio lipolyticus]